MAGYFDTGETAWDTANSASRDFDRLNAADPTQFTPRGIFDRLFNRKGGSQATGVSSAPLPPPAPATPQMPPPAPAGSPGGPPKPAISSAASLVKRILEGVQPPVPPSTQGPGIVPGTPFSPQQFGDQMRMGAHPLPPFQGIPQFNGPEPPMRQPPPPQFGGNQFGGNQFGGNQFGGNQFGGNRFGGNQFGASAPPHMMPPTGPPQGPPQMMPPGGPPPLQQSPMPPQQSAAYDPMSVLLSLARLYGGEHAHKKREPVGYFAHAHGGSIPMMRGGYPAHLMMGLPQRFAGGGNFVPQDGRGDGRSDHVPARLSPGEFVQDAETTALLGNGDGEAGARGWEAIRQEIRKEKGAALAKGKFSPAAKSPRQYARIGMRAAAGDR